jgi:hypothetical protein
MQVDTEQSIPNSDKSFTIESKTLSPREMHLESMDMKFDIKVNKVQEKDMSGVRFSKSQMGGSRGDSALSEYHSQMDQIPARQSNSKMGRPM